MDDYESVLDLVEMMHKRTGVMDKLFVISRNAFDPDGSTQILKRHLLELEKLIANAKNILSGMNGQPVIGPAAILRYSKP